MPRYKLIIEYNGAAYRGWQIQPDALTVEGELEGAFSKILQTDMDIIGQGRTDAGVHAKGQVAHIDLPDNIDIQKLIHGVNGLSGKDIQIVHFVEVHDDFHARFDASFREYEYRVLTYNSPLNNDFGWWPGAAIIPDITILNKCANMLIGEHDFDGFSKFNADNYTTICTIDRAEWKLRDNMLIFQIRANRFLRNMVRRLVGTMVEVSSGRMGLNEFHEILSNQGEEKRTYTAPAKGLILEKVFYPSDL